jgi:hypothetical protein
MVAPASSKEHLARLGALAVAAVASAALATSAASGTLARPQATPADGFAGPVAGPPQAIDRDLEPAGGPLRQVHCAVGDGTARCWVAPASP